MARNMLSEAADRFWYGRGQALADNKWLSEWDVRTISNLAFTDGARWAMRETAKLNPYVSKFVEMLILLGVFDDEQQLASAPDSASTGNHAPGDPSGARHG